MQPHFCGVRSARLQCSAIARNWRQYLAFRFLRRAYVEGRASSQTLFAAAERRTGAEPFPCRETAQASGERPTLVSALCGKKAGPAFLAGMLSFCLHSCPVWAKMGKTWIRRNDICWKPAFRDALSRGGREHRGDKAVRQPRCGNACGHEGLGREHPDRDRRAPAGLRGPRF